MLRVVLDEAAVVAAVDGAVSVDAAEVEVVEEATGASVGTLKSVASCAAKCACRPRSMRAMRAL